MPRKDDFNVDTNKFFEIIDERNIDGADQFPYLKNVVVANRGIRVHTTQRINSVQYASVLELCGLK